MVLLFFLCIVLFIMDISFPNVSLQASLNYFFKYYADCYLLLSSGNLHSSVGSEVERRPSVCDQHGGLVFLPGRHRVSRN